MSRNISHFGTESNNEDHDEDVNVDLNGVQEPLSEAQIALFDKKHPAGHQADITQSDAAYKSATNSAYEPQGSVAKKLNYVSMDDYFGELEDKLAANFHVYEDGIVAFFQSDLSTKERGPSLHRARRFY